MSIGKLEEIINKAWKEKDQININNVPQEYKLAIEECFTKIENGQLRAAINNNGLWQSSILVKKAILLKFKFFENQVIEGGFIQFYDKLRLQNTSLSKADFQEKGVRIVPPACVREGAFIAPNTILMPSYINVGAYVNTGTMIDNWATIGSCAQIGKNVHISAGVVIGGVLEPLQANPTIIEDNCFIGANSAIVEGVIIGKGAVLSMGIYIGQSTKIYDRENDKIYYGKVPEGAVVVPGHLPSANGKYSTYSAIIVKRVDEKTKSKINLNEILRDIK